jgi:hypothetical protein
MPCALTQGYTLDCKDSIGGLQSVYFAPWEDLGTVTVASGVVTTLTMDVGKKFYQYELVKESSNFAEAVNTNVQNGNEILLLAKNRLAVIVVDNNGDKWFLGQSYGLDLTGGGSGSGTAFGDRSGYTLTFTGNEKELAPKVTAVVPIA